MILPAEAVTTTASWAARAIRIWIMVAMIMARAMVVM
jgi:hypothetical protein